MGKYGTPKKLEKNHSFSTKTLLGVIGEKTVLSDIFAPIRVLESKQLLQLRKILPIVRFL